MVENLQVDKTPYFLKLAGRSLGLEGFELAQEVFGAVNEKAKRTTTLLCRLAGVPIAIYNFLCPSISKVIMDGTVMNDEAFDNAGLIDATSNSLAAIAALIAGAYTRNVGIGIATYLASRTMLNAMTHIGRDLLQQTNPDGGLA